MRRGATAARIWRFGGLLVALLSSLGPAETRTMQQKFEQACAAAADRLCRDAKADPDGIKACLIRHRDQVDPACMRMVDAAE